MSKPFARAVFALTAVFFAAFFLWPILQILKGGFIDADGRLTLAPLAAALQKAGQKLGRASGVVRTAMRLKRSENGRPNRNRTRVAPQGPASPTKPR